MYDRLMDICFTGEGMRHVFRFNPEDFTPVGVSSKLFNEISSYLAKLTNGEHVSCPKDYLTVDELIDELNGREPSLGRSLGYTICCGFERDQPITERWISYSIDNEDKEGRARLMEVEACDPELHQESDN